MARDHFLDIIPPERNHKSESHAEQSYDDEQDPHSLTVASTDKSIRNINITRRAVPADPGRTSPRAGGGRLWLWILAGICVCVVALIAVIYVFRRTTVTVVPHTQPVTFDQTMQFTAYPSNSSASGTMTYNIAAADFSDSQTVTASGTTHEDSKANGSIIVYNSYSASPIKLVKTTRFETASGLVFRTPEAIEIPGQQGNTPGKVTITVVADTAGSQYNIGPGQRLTLPGLSSNSSMYGAIYATTAASTSGGFSGNVPAIADSDLQAAYSALEGRLQQKANAYASSAAAGGVSLAPQLTFTKDTPTTAQNGQATVVEHAHAAIAFIPSDQLAAAVAQAVTADSSTISYTIAPGSNFSASIVGTAPTLGSDPITFSMNGSATLISRVDISALASALAGRDSAAFEAIVRNFPGVESAQARIEPFWQGSFPSNPADMQISVAQPQK